MYESACQSFEMQRHSKVGRGNLLFSDLGKLPNYAVTCYRNFATLC